MQKWRGSMVILLWCVWRKLRLYCCCSIIRYRKCLPKWHAIAAVNTLRPRQNGRHVSYDIFKWIFLNENVWISLKIWPKFVPKVWINNIPALVQIMAWRRPGDKPLSEPMKGIYVLKLYIYILNLWSQKNIMNPTKTDHEMLKLKQDCEYRVLWKQYNEMKTDSDRWHSRWILWRYF